MLSKPVGFGCTFCSHILGCFSRPLFSGRRQNDETISAVIGSQPDSVFAFGGGDGYSRFRGYTARWETELFKYMDEFTINLSVVD